MFRVTSASEHVPGGSPAALVRDGRNLVLVLAAGLLDPHAVRHLDVLLRTALTPLMAAADADMGEASWHGVG